MVHFPSKNNPTVCTLFSISANSPVKRKLESNSSESLSISVLTQLLVCMKVTKKGEKVSSKKVAKN